MQKARKGVLILLATLFLVTFLGKYPTLQEKIRTSYASVGATNAIWNIAKEQGFYQKNGLNAEVVDIGSTTVNVAAILGEDVPVGMAGGSGVANAAVRTLIW